MTKEEINEIQTAVDHIKAVCIDDPLPGKYYDLCRAVLPLLEHGIEYWNMAEAARKGEVRAYGFYELKLMFTTVSQALHVARGVNQKQRMTILDDKRKKDVKAGTKTAAEYTAKMPKYKVKLNPEVLKKLKKEGRIIDPADDPNDDYAKK